MSALLRLLSIISLLVNVQSYWLSQNLFDWQSASTYCSLHCNSTLVSIHSSDEHENIRNYLLNHDSYITLDDYDNKFKNIFIGLNKMSDNITWEWSDGTPLDFGGGTSGGIYPWRDNEPGGERDCAAYSYDQDYAWEDQRCDRKRRFLCNSCEGVLEKYILYNQQSLDCAAASSYCQSLTIPTNLISIHNEEDMDSAKALCSAKKETNDCWIGLNANLIWSDGTQYDYGSNVDFGAYPWAPLEPSISGDECVYLTENQDYRWSVDDDTSVTENTVICEKPNEFCYGDQWQVIDEPPGDVIFEGCNALSDDDGVAVLKNKKWTWDNIPIKIEYVFKVNYQTDLNSDIGITIHHFNGTGLHDFTGHVYDNHSVCEYQFFGIHIANNGSVYGKFTRWMRGTYENWYPSNRLFENIKFNTYYRIGIVYDFDGNGGNDPDWWNLRLRLWMEPDELFDGGWGYSLYVNLGGWQVFSDDKYIGIRNSNVSITGKSLYISGTPQYINNNTFSQCVDPPTSLVNCVASLCTLPTFLGFHFW